MFTVIRMRTLLNILLLNSLFFTNTNIISDVDNYQNVSRLVVMSDIHCDLDRFKYILQQANIIDDKLDWIADPVDTMVVQLGDQLDPKKYGKTFKKNGIDPNYNVIYFTEELKKKAEEKGGKFISLIGNHEYLNIDMYDSQTYDIIADRRISIKVNEFILCHGGIMDKHIKLLQQYNLKFDNINDLWKKYLKDKKSLTDLENMLIENLISNEDSILFTRKLDDYEGTQHVLDILESKYLIVGHKPVKNIIIENDLVIYTDMLLEKAFNNMRYQYLDIIKNDINIKTIEYQEIK